MPIINMKYQTFFNKWLVILSQILISFCTDAEYFNFQISGLTY